jgi:hypothetical protein
MPRGTLLSQRTAVQAASLKQILERRAKMGFWDKLLDYSGFQYPNTEAEQVLLRTSPVSAVSSRKRALSDPSPVP